MDGEVIHLFSHPTILVIPIWINDTDVSAEQRLRPLDYIAITHPQRNPDRTPFRVVRVGDETKISLTLKKPSEPRDVSC